MKRLFSILAVVLTSVSFFSCEKDKYELEDNIALNSFTLEPTSNPGLSKTIQGVIEDKNVYIRVPNAVDIKAAVPSFTTNSEKIVGFVGTKVIESGLTTLDLSSPLIFRLNSPNGLSEYNVIGLKSASILSFGFYAEDNEGKLFKDYPAVISKLAINVDLPIDADITSLVARYTTSDGAVVKHNGNIFASAATAVDYNEVVALELMDAEMEQPEVFSITVGRLTAPVWSEVALPDFFNVSTSAAKLEINPATNQPYVMIQRSGSPDSIRKAVIAGYDIASKIWKSAGPTSGFSETRVDVISFSFNNEGDIYAAYKDYATGNGAQFASAQKFHNNKWEYVGGIQGSFDRVNVLSSQVDKNDVPYISYALARAAAPYATRSTIVQSFNNGWTTNTIPEISTNVFTKLIKGKDDNLYLLLMNVTNRKPSIFKLENGTWKVVGNIYVGPAIANSAYGLDFDADVTEDGQVYLGYQAYEGTTYKTYVMHWDGTTWSQLGDGYPAVVSNVTTSRNNVAVKVHPDGRVFFAYGDGGQGLKVTTFNPETGNWNPATVVTTKAADKYELRITKEGIPYLVTIIDSKAVLFKFDIPGQ